MAAGLTRDDRAGQVLIQVRVHSAGDMRARISAPPAPGIVQREAAIDHRPVGAGEMPGEISPGHKCGVGHEDILHL